MEFQFNIAIFRIFFSNRKDILIKYLLRFLYLHTLNKLWIGHAKFLTITEIINFKISWFFNVITCFLFNYFSYWVEVLRKSILCWVYTDHSIPILMEFLIYHVIIFVQLLKKPIISEVWCLYPNLMYDEMFPQLLKKI